MGATEEMADLGRRGLPLAFALGVVVGVGLALYLRPEPFVRRVVFYSLPPAEPGPAEVTEGMH